MPTYRIVPGSAVAGTNLSVWRYGRRNLYTHGKGIDLKRPFLFKACFQFISSFRIYRALAFARDLFLEHLL